MCGRYVFWEDETDEEFQKIVYELHEKHPDLDLGSGEIAPSERAPVLVGDLQPELFTWGYPGFAGGRLLINARAETASSKKTFQESLYRRRCLVPATGFFEWSADRRMHLFRPRGGGALYLAGLYQPGQPEPRFVIVTTQANASVSSVHPRMPLLVPESKRREWLTNTAFAVRYLETPVSRLPLPEIKSIVYQ